MLLLWIVTKGNPNLNNVNKLMRFKKHFPAIQVKCVLMIVIIKQNITLQYSEGYQNWNKLKLWFKQKEIWHGKYHVSTILYPLLLLLSMNIQGKTEI